VNSSGGLPAAGRRAESAGGRLAESGDVLRVVSLGVGFGTVNVRRMSVELPTRFRMPRAVMRYVIVGSIGVVGDTVTITARSGGGDFGLGGGGAGRGDPGVTTGGVGGGAAGCRVRVESLRRAESASCACRA